MKKPILFVLALALALSAVPAFAETASAGVWEKRAFVDEFNLPTDDYYVINKAPFTGTFSNSATTNSDLLAYLIIDADYVGVRLIEYGDYVVKNSFSKDEVYSTALMDPAGEKYYFDGTMAAGSDRIVYKSEARDMILDALCQDGIVRFSITEKDNEVSRYIFAVADTAGFADVAPIKQAGAVSEGLIAAKVGSKWGYVDLNGEWVIPCQFDNASSFSCGLARVQKNEKYGYVNAAGEVAISFAYDSADSFSDGVAAVKNISYAGLIDTSGNKVAVPGDWEEVGSYSEGLVSVKKYGVWGFATLEGEIAIDCKYMNASTFHEGLAAEGATYIDTEGNKVITGEWAFVSAFSSGMACVCNRQYKYAYIDYAGNEIIPYGTYNAGRCEDGLIITTKDGGMPVYDLNGAELIPPVYAFTDYGEGYFTLVKDGELTILPREEVQPNWEAELAAYEAELEGRREAAAKEAEARAAEAERQKMLTEYTDKETVKKVQAALNEAGFPCGTPDGAAGKKTIAALTDYQTAKNLTVTGTITHETLISMGLAG